MQVNLDRNLSLYMIRSYSPGAIAISTPGIMDRKAASETPRPAELETINGSFILSPRNLINHWPVDRIEDLRQEHLNAILELKPELVILGTGSRIIFPEAEILMPIHEQQIGVEVMDTAAACRTYNILMAEGRFVVAGFINPAQ